MPKVEIKVSKDNTDAVLKALKDKLPIALGAVGAEATRYAVLDCPVDTGRLQTSIAWATSKESGGGSSKPQAKPEDNVVYIGTNVEYAVYVEYGDYSHTSGKKHYLRDAAANHKDHYMAILEAALKS